MSELTRIRAFAAGLAVLTALVAACDRTTTPSSTSGKPQESAPTSPPAVYIVRGQVEDLPDPARPMSTFDLHHEAIDNFVGSDGTIGMNAMSMTFPLAEGVSVNHLAKGDIVQVVFEVQWRPVIRYHVTKVTKLPADTKLEFRAARPAEPSAPPSPGGAR